MPESTATRILSEPAVGLGRPRRVRRFLNVSTLLLIALGTIWAAYALTGPHYGLLIGDLVLIGIGGIAFLLLRRGWILASIHWLLIGLLLWVAAMAYFVSGSGSEHDGAVHYWLIVYIVGLHFVLFDAARIVQTFYVSMAILVFIVVEYNLVSLQPLYGLPAQDVLFSHGLTLGLVLIVVTLIMRTYIASLAEAEHRVRDANQRSEQLLHSVLPASIVARVRAQGSTFTQQVDNCSVLFADIVGFTPMSARLSSEELVALLNRIFRRFDALAEQHGVEKIKTIGDGYMAACGLPEAVADHAQRIITLAQDMLNAIDEFEGLSIRIGINSGPVHAGIIGQQRIAFDLWGETVNLASRMESHGKSGRIQVTAASYELLKGEFTFDPGHIVDVKGKGPLTAYLVSI